MREDIKILYVEDEESVRTEFQEVLALNFDNIVTATNGLEGLELYKEYRPDLIISDIQMPKMGGLTMSKNIKKIDKDAKIILTTAFNEEVYIDEAENLKIAYYLKKPINIKELHTAIETLFKTNTQEENK